MKTRGFGHIEEVKEVKAEPVEVTQDEVVEPVAEESQHVVVEDETAPVVEEAIEEFAPVEVTAEEELVAVARDVLKGLYGSDPARRRRLTEKGYDPDKVQEIVKKLIS